LPAKFTLTLTLTLILSNLVCHGRIKIMSKSGSGSKSKTARCGLTEPSNQARMGALLWGRTGFDLIDTPEAACRGRFVGLVNPRTKIKC